MASDPLVTLRGMPAQLASQYREYQKKAAAIKQNPFITDQVRAQQLGALASAAHAALAEYRAQTQAHAAALRQKTASCVQPDAESRMIVRDLLAEGMDYSQIAQILASVGNRAGLAALREQLPYQGAKGNLGGKDHVEKRVADAQATLDALESQLLDPGEQAAHEEARELNACYGMLESSINKLKQYYQNEQNPILMGHNQDVNQIYNWVGLPGHESNGQPYINLANDPVGA